MTYEITLVNKQYYSVIVEARSLEEAEKKGEEMLSECGSLKPYDGESYVDTVTEV